MKFLIYTAFLATFASSGFSRTDTFAPEEIRLSAQFIDTVGSFRKLSGQVRIETAHVIVQADQAVYNTGTSDVQPIGNVHITLKESGTSPR